VASKYQNERGERERGGERHREMKTKRAREREKGARTGKE
jgi:hypothetical protein